MSCSAADRSRQMRRATILSGPSAHFIASGNGGPALVTLVREPDGWKVDLRWWLALLDMADAPAPTAGSAGPHNPELAARAHRSRSKRSAARGVLGADINLLFTGAPSVREPSGVLEASAMEMPLVEVGTGEFYRLPSGRVVEGSSAADRRVFVGQLVLSRSRLCCAVLLGYGASRQNRTSC